MEKNIGTWIRVDSTPAQFLANGSPKAGDPVIINYREDTQIWAGVVKIIGSKSDTLIDTAKSPEYGADMLFSPIFGL